MENIEYEWCRKGKYEVQVQLGCYKVDENHPMLPGFMPLMIAENGGISKYAVKVGTNILEGNAWVTSPTYPFIITGTVGEMWPVRNLESYEVNEEIGIEPSTISTKDPSMQEFLVATRIPLGLHVKVATRSSFDSNGVLDESKLLTTNLEDSNATHHAEGDFVIAKHIEGEPEYISLPEEVRNTKEIAEKYRPRVISGEVFEKTYDHAKTREEILAKYKNKGLKN